MATVFAIVALSFFLWPLALRELAPLRLDTLRVGAIGNAGGAAAGGLHGRRRAHQARTIVAAQAGLQPRRDFGLLDALPNGERTDLQAVPPAAPAISADLPAFSTAASAIASFNPPSSPSSGPDQGFPFLTTPAAPARRRRSFHCRPSIRRARRP